jgi:methionyl-tRNA synthetase
MSNQQPGKPTFYITTPIYFPSGNPHIGTCYTTVACDTIARYKRGQGYDVIFSTGTDEHTEKVVLSAEKAGLPTMEYLDGIVGNYKKLWQYMNISYDRFIRTTDDYHVKVVQNIFVELYNKGHIYKGEYIGQYCMPCESYWTATQLVDGNCPDCGRPVTPVSEEAYFFRLSAFSERLEKLLTETDYLRPENRVRELISSFIRPGLEDLCVSRTSLNWGIPLPFDPKHVIYVWVDALPNYLSLLGYTGGDNSPDFARFWPADLHMTAKEIMRFHALTWPAMLMALDLPLPKKLYSHGWMNFNGEKISKSKGSSDKSNIDPFLLGELYGVDAVRYQILRDMPYASDMEYSNSAAVTRINSDLANDLGNLISRTTAMAEKYFGGKLIPEREHDNADYDLISMASGLRERVDALIDEPKLQEALIEIFKVVSRANKYIDENAPWVLAKDECKRPRLATVLYNLLEAIRITTGLLSSFMPESMARAHAQICADAKQTDYDSAGRWGILPAETEVNRGDVIFPRIQVAKD